MKWDMMYDGGELSSRNDLIRSHLYAELREAFTKGESFGNVHEEAQKMLRELPVHVSHAERLVHDKERINELAGALFSAVHHIGEFAVVSEDLVHGSLSAVAERICLNIERSYPQAPPASPPRSSRSFCFPERTLILLANGNMVPIETVSVGDTVLACNEQNKMFAPARALEVLKARHEGCFDLNFGLLRVTGEHPLFVRKRTGQEGWAVIAHTRAGHRLPLEVGDELFTSKQIWLRVSDITFIPGEINVYNLKRVESPHTFFAGSVLVHNIKSTFLYPNNVDTGVLVHNGPKEIGFLAHNKLAC